MKDRGFLSLINRSSPAVASAKEERHEDHEVLRKYFNDGFDGWMSGLRMLCYFNSYVLCLTILCLP